MKLLQIACTFISIFVWVTTNSATIDSLRQSQPAAKAQVAQQVAANAQVEAQTVAMTEELQRKFISKYAYMAGEFDVLMNNGEKYRYLIQAEPVFLPKGSLEGEGLYLNVWVSLDKDERAIGFYRGTVEINNESQFTLRLEERDITKAFPLDTALDRVDYVPESFLVAVDAGGNWNLTIQESPSQMYKLKGRMTRLATQSLSQFEGKWQGAVGESPLTIELKSNGKFLESTYNIMLSFACIYSGGHGRLNGDGRISIIGGKPSTENYSSCSVPLIRAQILPDGQLKVLHYWNAGEPTTGILQRK